MNKTQIVLANLFQNRKFKFDELNNANCIFNDHQYRIETRTRIYMEWQNQIEFKRIQINSKFQNLMHAIRDFNDFAMQMLHANANST